MTVVVPDPVPLEMPQGDPVALEDFVEDVAGTAYRLAVVSTCLTSSSTGAPHWRGADASAAAAQIDVVASLADELSGGVAAAAHRLRTHHDRLIQARQRIAALRVQQDEDFAVAWGRLSRIENYQLVAMTDGAQAVGVVEELEAAEAARRREHGRLLEEVADDAAAAARTLAEASRAVGGSGRRGSEGQVVAHMAAQLPGWGDAELRRRGADLAEALTAGPVTPEEMNELARISVDHAGSATFARGLFVGLGVDGVRWLISSLGSGRLGPSSDVARVLAGAFGAATPNDRTDDPVRTVLTATYVAPDDRHGDADVAAVGLAALLLARGVPGGGAVRPETAAGWTRQMLARERAQGVPAGAGTIPADWDSRALAPAELAFAAVAASGESAPAAELLSDRGVWDTVLSRFWADGGEALSEVVALAGAEPGLDGSAAVRSGLEALGAGLSADGDPENWTVREEMAVAVAGSLGNGVAVNVEVATDALLASVDGELGGRNDHILRGLGYLTLDRGAADTVGSALCAWAGGQPLPTGESVEGASRGALAIPGAYVAVQEYGQRLAYAMHGFQAQAAAETAETAWKWTWGLAVEFVRGPLGIPAGVAVDYAAIFLGADGTWDNGIDGGLVLSREDAVREAIDRLEPEDAAAARELAVQTRAAYDHTADALGLPKPPMSEKSDYLEPLFDAAADVGLDKIQDAAKAGGAGLRVGSGG